MMVIIIIIYGCIHPCIHPSRSWEGLTPDPPGTTVYIYIYSNVYMRVCIYIECPFSTKIEGQPFIVRGEIPHGSQGRPNLNRGSKRNEGAHHCLTPSWNMSKLKVLFIHSFIEAGGCARPIYIYMTPYFKPGPPNLAAWTIMPCRSRRRRRRRGDERESRALVTDERTMEVESKDRLRNWKTWGILISGRLIYRGIWF